MILETTIINTEACATFWHHAGNKSVSGDFFKNFFVFFIFFLSKIFIQYWKSTIERFGMNHILGHSCFNGIHFLYCGRWGKKVFFFSTAVPQIATMKNWCSAILPFLVILSCPTLPAIFQVYMVAFRLVGKHCANASLLAVMAKNKRCSDCQNIVCYDNWSQSMLTRIIRTMTIVLQRAFTEASLPQSDS